MSNGIIKKVTIETELSDGQMIRTIVPKNNQTILVFVAEPNSLTRGPNCPCCGKETIGGACPGGCGAYK